MANNIVDSNQSFSSVAQTANLGTSTSVSSGAAKIFREFKWGLLTLFILMAVVVGLVYDGGRNKKKTDAVGAVKAGETPDPGSVLNTPNGDAAANTGTATVAPQPSPNTGLVLGGSGDALNGPTPPVNQPPAETTNTVFDSLHPGSHPVVGQTQNGNRPPNTVAGADDPTHRAPKNTDKGPRPGNTVTENPGTAPAGEARQYVVKSGDNLTRIATLHQLGKNGVKAILSANKDVLHDANMLREGMKLKIPAAGSTHAEASARPNNEHDPAPSHGSEHAQREGAHGGDSYTVQTGDTLERIARRVLNDGQRWKDILEWNKDKIAEPTRIRVGMVLRMKGGEVRPEAGPVHGTGNAVRADYDPPAPQPRDREVHTEPNTEPETADLTTFPVSASRAVPQPKQPAAATRTQFKDPNPAPRIPAPDGDEIP